MKLRFWLINIVLVIIAVVIAVVLIKLRSDNPPDAVQPQTIEDNFTSFYRKFRNYRDTTFQDPSGQYYVELDPPTEAIGKRLSSLPNRPPTIDKPLEGKAKPRAFATDGFIGEELARFAQQEGIILLWDLPKDFKVKDRFVLDGSIADATGTLVNVISQNFSAPVYAFVCPKKRTYVVTQNVDQGVQRYCQAL